MSESSAERAIGRLEGSVENLAKMVEIGQQEGREGRSKIYKELEAIRAEASKTIHEVNGLRTRIDEAAPVISDIRKWRERFVGMQMLAAAFFAFIGGSAVIAWKWIALKLGL